MNPCQWHRRVSWGLQLLAALILGQTLFFKFTAAPESVYIFNQLGAEPWGRLGSGVVELVAVVLLLVPRTAALGGLLGAAVMSGAVVSHLTKLGLVVQGDGGLLFVLAVVTLGCCGLVVWLRRGELPFVGRRFLPSCPSWTNDGSTRHIS